MNYGEVLTAQAITVKQWNRQLFSEYLQDYFWFRFTGMDDGAIIHVKEDLSKLKGDTINFQIRSEIIGGLQEGTTYTSSEGNEGMMEFYNWSVSLKEVRRTVKFEGVKLSNQRVAFELLSAARPALSDANRQKLEADTTTMLTDTASGRVQARYMYGALDSNWNATHATALTNVDNTNDKQSTTMIEDCKLKARLSGYAKIRPWKVKTGMEGGIEKWFVYVMHPYCARDMKRNDASWKNAAVNLPPTTNMKSPIYSGSTFLGSWDGVLLYEWDGIPLVSSTIVTAHNMLLGAQAGVLSWSQHPEFDSEAKDFGQIQRFQSDEIRGEGKVVWDRNTVDGNIANEDNGVVHCFAAAVA